MSREILPETFVGMELERASEALDRIGCLGATSIDALNYYRSAFPPNAPWDELSRVQRAKVVVEIERMVSFESYVPSPDWAPALSRRAYQAIWDIVDEFRDTLPYAPAERRWLATAYQRTSELTYEETPDVLEADEGFIVSSGLHQVVQGRDLLARWVDWRRGAGVFEDSGAFSDSIVALGKMATLIPPPA